METEIEARSFITKQKHDELLDFFKNNAKLIKEDFQESIYFDSKEDLRIQRNNFFSKIWLKKGKLHDKHREEIEIKFERDDFERIKGIFLALGYNTDIIWLRKRHKFDWNGITVCLDHTNGYGYIIELEKLCSEYSESQKKEQYELLQKKLKELDVSITPKKEFEEKFDHYKKNWKKLIQN